MKIFLAQFTALCFLLTSCTRQLEDCNGPAMNLGAVANAQVKAVASGPKAKLVVPNPLDATTQQSGSDLQSLVTGYRGLGLSGLLNGNRLDNPFLKIRSGTIQESADLATPNANGEYDFETQDVRYAQTMAYHAVNSMQAYVKALGFTVDQSRPLYVLVRSKEDPNDPNSKLDTTYANAFYQHNKENPGAPRMIQVFGAGKYALSIDRDTYWHEFGHLFNESVSRDVGIDDATTAGASFVQSRSIHECLADYLSESVGNKDYIGKWGAHNYSTIAPGNPIRSAADRGDDKSRYASVATNNGAGYPENYALAEWCTRVLWDMRTQFTKEDPSTGSYVADRLMYSALSMVKKDASMREFLQAVKSADEKLHCGLHERSITNAMESRGFSLNQPSVSQPLTISVTPTGVTEVNSQYQIGTPSVNSVEIFHPFRLSNPNAGVARNVRIQITSTDLGVVPLIYLQGYGDIPAGRSVVVGADTVDNLLKTVSFVADKSRISGGRVRYQLKVLVENGPTTTKSMELPL